jgi:hypothetical protein
MTASSWCLTIPGNRARDGERETLLPPARDCKWSSREPGRQSHRARFERLVVLPVIVSSLLAQLSERLICAVGPQ